MEELLNQLEHLGFYRYEERSMITVLKALSMQTQSPWLFEGRYQYQDLDSVVETEAAEVIEGELWLHYTRPLNHLYFLSREDLYEYPPYGFEELQSVLEAYGVNVNVSDIDEYETDEGDRGIVVNETEYLVCPEFISSSGVHYLVRWNCTVAKFLMILNVMLAEAQSEKRVYVIRGADEDEDGLYIAFLSSQMNQLILESSILEAEKPQQIETYFSKYLEIR